MSADGRVTLAHNGIIENYIPLKLMLESEGVVFKSETDTERLPLILSLSIINRIRLKPFIKQCAIFAAHFALAIMFEGFSDELYAVKKAIRLLSALETAVMRTL